MAPRLTSAAQLLASVSGTRQHAVDLTGKLNVQIGDPALGMRTAAEGDGTPADVDVGMVIARLSNLGHRTDGFDGRREAGQCRGTHDRVTVTLPIREPFQGICYPLVVPQLRHTVILAEAATGPTHRAQEADTLCTGS